MESKEKMIAKKEKVIFISVPKCAASTMNIILVKHNNIEFVKRHWHYSIESLSKFLNSEGENLADYFKFCISRNPYDRLVSAFSYNFDRIKNSEDYHWDSYREQYLIMEQFIDPKSKIESFRKFIPSPEFELMFNENKTPIHFRPQVDFVTIRGDLKMDYVGRFEDLDSTFKFLEKEINIKTTKVHKNRSNHEHYKNFYNKQCKDVAARLYHEDFVAFDYHKFNFNGEQGQ